MRPRDRDDVKVGAGADFGLEHGLVGIGDALPSAPRGLDEAVRLAGDLHGDKAARMLERFAALPDGTFVWTLAPDGTFRLGRLAGPWHYDDGPRAREVGIHHVRRTTWIDRPFGEGEVPAEVEATFGRGGRNLQRIHGPRVDDRTAAMWEAERDG
ncbi:MAG: hypothetical protein Q7T55_15500 [Solirubrobacteraceae bacterium]|nr:hypothetical protein [Solirubrobacteraceae bacterium]